MNQLSVLKLFKGYIGEQTGKIRKDGLKYGLLIPQSAPNKVYTDAIKLYGRDGKQWNQTFHKSWNKVATADIGELVYEQIIHYMTTYGFEDLGIFSHESVYLPHERLKIPELAEDIELICIHAYTEEEVSEKLMILLTSGIALSKDTINCIADLAGLIDISRFEEIKNREARIALCDAFSIAPKDPDEFLRYLIYKVSGSTLKIQDQATYNSLRSSSRKQLLELFGRYLSDGEEEAMKKLASVFLRNKLLFLAMRTSWKEKETNPLLTFYRSGNNNDEAEAKELNHLINRIAKLAKKYHRPLPLNRLDRLTAPSTQIGDDELVQALDTITVFREIRILNGLAYALDNSPSILYKIRNGRSFATNRDTLKEADLERIQRRHQIVRKHLIERLKPLLEGKTVRLPDDFIYKAPTSEKQFVSAFPCGSSIQISRDRDVVFGIHWTNLELDDDNNARVDLDLHMQNLGASFGWNSAYRDRETDLYFSGDLTDAPLPDGASELFYIGKNVEDVYMFSINNYNQSGVKVPFEVVVAKTKEGMSPADIEENHVLDPNDIVVKIPMEMPASESMMRLGFVYFTQDAIKVVFDSFNSRRRIVSDNEDPVFENTFNYLQASQKSSLALADLLKECGALIVNETSQEKADFDLSLNALTKDTIISLFQTE